MQTISKIAIAVVVSTFVTTQSVDSQTALQQNILEVKRFTDRSVGGECILKTAKLSAVENIVTKTFEFEAPQSADYYVYSWSMGLRSPKGIETYQVFVDDAPNPNGVLQISGADWGTMKLVNSSDGTPRRIHLSAGQHSISFRCSAPNTPAVDYVRFAKDEKGAVISEVDYRRFMSSLKTSQLPVGYTQSKRDSSLNILKKVVNNPEGDYVHEIGKSFSYTYYQTFYYASSGSQVTFETKKADPYASDPVIMFFNYDDPVNKGSWTNDDGGQGNQAKLTVTIPYSGYYILFIFSFGLGTTGTSDLYLNDNLYSSDIPLTHAGVRCDHSNTEELNYFTAHLTGDSRIWIEDQDGFPGKIRAYNDDFGCPGDFDWGNNARVRRSLSMPIRAAQLSAYSSSNPTGSCDLYMKCGSIGYYMIDFPNMDTVDAIRSAPENNYYNCASWSGGITTSNEWPPNYGSNWNNGNSSHSDTLAAFDNYYGNKDRYGIEELRYADSRKWNYTNSGADASNSQIALWVTPTGLFQHASVNSRWDNISYAEPADSNAHGYDWESKDGNGPRVFHPRDAIGGEPGYGQISRYYKLASGLLKQGARFVTSDESIQSGASVLDNGALTKSELAKLDSLKQFINGQELQDFVTKYLAWKKTWSTPAIRKYSDPRKYAESREYYDFLGYCREKGKKIFPLLLEQLDPEDFFLIVAIEDLTYAGSEKLMEEVHQENRSHRYTEQGAFIMHSLLGNWMKYGKKILSRFAEYNGFVQAPQQFATSEPGKGPNESIFLQNYPNPFNPSTEIKYWLASAGEVSVKVYDILGKEVSVIVDNKFQEQGSYTVRWNGKLAGGDQAPSGVYFCRVQTNSVSQIVKLLLMR